jgi:hypothetical protein
MNHALIDLGEIQPGPAAPPPPPLPPPPAPGGPWRPWLVAVLLAAGLALGGATHLGAGLVELPSVDYVTGDAFQIAGDQLYVASSTSRSSAHLAAYRLPSGRGLWDVPLQSQVGRLLPVPDAGLLLSVSEDVNASLTVLDPETGRVRWHSDASFVDLAPDRTAAVVAVASAAGYRVELVDLTTGDRRWEWPAPDVAGLSALPDVLLSAPATVDGPELWRVVLWQRPADILVLDGRTGQPLTTGRMEVQPLDAPGNPSPPFVASVGDLILLGQQAYDDGVLDSYDVRTLQRRWRARNAALAFVSYLDNCGPVICLGSYPNGLSGIDPLTGQVRWSDAFRTQAIPLPAGRLLAFQAPMVDPAMARRAAILDADTGAVVEQLGDWWWPPAGPNGHTLLVARPERTLASSFAVVDLTTGVVAPLGTLPLWPYECQADGRYFACPATDSRLHIWRYRT